MGSGASTRVDQDFQMKGEAMIHQYPKNSCILWVPAWAPIHSGNPEVFCLGGGVNQGLGRPQLVYIKMCSRSLANNGWLSWCAVFRINHQLRVGWKKQRKKLHIAIVDYGLYNMDPTLSVWNKIQRLDTLPGRCHWLHFKLGCLFQA